MNGWPRSTGRSMSSPPLRHRDREVLLLWDAGLSYPEIAAQTNLAVGAVGTTLARARKRLVAVHERQTAGRMDDAAHS